MKSIPLLALMTCILVSMPALAATPQAGSSRFEQFFAGYPAGTAPTDFVTLLSDLGKNDLPVLSAMQIPDSRSLQRAFISCAEPRTIVAVKSKVNSSFAQISQEPASFLGYARKAEQVEAISWNPGERRYEFLILTGFAPGKKPSLARADRAICTTCHQSEGPIFARFPWSETTFQDGIRQAILGCPGFSVNKIPLTNDGFVFDDEVRRANRSLQAVRICRDLCKPGDLACRRSLLILSLESSRATQLGVESIPGLNESIMALQPGWPSDGFRYVSSVLPDRRPLENPEKGGTTSVYVNASDSRIFFPDSSRTEDFTYDESLSNTQPVARPDGTLEAPDGLESLKELRILGIGSLADPSEPRPKVSSLYLDQLVEGGVIRQSEQQDFARLARLSSICFGLADEDVSRITSQLDTVLKRLSGDPGVATLLGGSNWPPSRNDLMAALFPEDAARAAGDDEREITEDIGAVSGTGAGRPVDRARALMNFQKYCSECHAPQTYQQRSGFLLPLGGLDELRSYDRPGLVERYLRDRIMPIASASLQLTESERDEMARSLDGG